MAEHKGPALWGQFSRQRQGLIPISLGIEEAGIANKSSKASPSGAQAR